MALPNPAAGDTILASHITDIKSTLEGGTGMTAAYSLKQSSGDMQLTLADAIGTNKLRINNSAGTQVASIDSLGNGTFAGISLAALTLPLSVAPALTAAGAIQYDTVRLVPTIGTGTATKSVGLTRGAGNNATATNELVYDTTAVTLKVWDGSTSQQVGPSGYLKAVFKYKTSAQVFTTNTTFADVTASSGSFAFAIATSEVWLVEYVMQVSWTGTGGTKFQLTGPAAPTSVVVLTQMPIAAVDGGSLAIASPNSPTTSVFTFDVAATAFSSSFGARNGTTGTSTTSPNLYLNGSGAQGAFVRITALIQNGANAGTVTLQAAQNSSNAATSFGVGSFMRAERIA